MTSRLPRRTVLCGMIGGLAPAAAGTGAGSAMAAERAPGTIGKATAQATVRGKGQATARGKGQAAGPEPYVPVAVGAGGGPAGTDRVHVLKVGPDSAATVLVLVPGMFGAANDFRLLARDLVAAVPGLQVWALDRRQENLVDRTGFTGPDPLTYYLDGHYRAQDPAASPFAAHWGLPLALADLRTVVRSAARGGRRVMLGGHSWGATTAMAYAAWDFDGCPGYRDLAGLVAVDGGVLGAFHGTGEPPVQDSPDEIRDRLAAIDAGAVFDLTLSGVGLGSRAESTQIWYQLAGHYALHDPDGPSVLQPRLPEARRLPYRVTNAGLLGFFVDTGFGWPNSITVHSGHLADSGDLRGWVDTGITPMSRVAASYAGPVPTVWEWYWPARLSVDLDVTDAYTDSPLARSLGLRLHHADRLDVPLYAFGTSYAKGTIEEAARTVVADSRIPYAVYETDTGMNHLDPLFAAPARNTLTRTLSEFLRRPTAH
ncbi:alpha/beta hydrolase [Streptomyces graminilatus]|uniref:alpha/beta hydrolase n=1 Tax=Streptomyces graminilatus TaxID=1464070 RepID=UPI0006E2D675|nr:Tat pathway signal sequence domain protein [Streptomyces graminilatus]